MKKKGKFTVLMLIAVAVSLMATAGFALAEDKVVPDTPKNFNAIKDGVSYKAKLTWEKSKNATNYQIYRATKKNGKYKRIATVAKDKTVYINKKLKKNFYYYKIRAVRKADGDTTYSKFSSVKTVCTKYQITGTSDITVKRLAKYFKKSGHKYPKYYKKTDAKTLTEFCEMYVEEAKAEGIRGEVAFVQAMLETGWLTYRGDVKKNQHNFAGLGATGGGKRGLSFKTVRIGIRAQVQHLKAYANKQDLNKKCVDKRFKYVARGCAPYVEWLGMKENPKGKGWAATAGYGKGLLKMLAKI